MRAGIYLLMMVVMALLIESCSKNENPTPSNPPTFGVISDVHFGLPDDEEKVSRGLKMLVKQTPRIQALFVVGDITELGVGAEYVKAMRIFSENVPSDIPIYYMMGNHDRTADQAGILFTQHTKQKTNQYVEIGGHAFITLSVEGGIAVIKGPNCYSVETKNFLEEKMTIAAKKFPEKPIFVFCHIPVSNTIWGTADPDDNASDVLTPILNSYPQAIVFSGHTHFTVADERSIQQGKFTSINDGGSAYGTTIKGVETLINDQFRPKGSHEVTEALHVTVKENKNVEVRRLDTYREELIKSPWVIEAPHNGTRFKYTNSRTGGKKAEFPSNASITFSEIGGKECTVTFTQAKNDDIVYCYPIEVKDESGSVVKTLRIFSQFWSGSAMPDPLSWTFKGLTPRTTYTITIRAEDSFGQQSDNELTGEFKTAIL